MTKLTKATYITLNKDLTTKNKVIIETTTEQEFYRKNKKLVEDGYILTRLYNIIK